MPIKIDYEKCCWKDGKCSSCCCGKSCVGCVETCTAGAISRQDVVKIDASKCTECGACVAACKHEALSLS
ncbi:MAG: 4Fe-4S binding protein [Patescibacteria group bacterium]|nr:4Fe-4S binding protein [Patescibacteria group bacterium]